METPPRRRAPSCPRIFTVVLTGLVLAGSAHALRVADYGFGPARGALGEHAGGEDRAGVPASLSAVGDRLFGLGPGGAFSIDEKIDTTGIDGVATEIPESETALLIGLGLAGLGVAGRRRDSPRP